jgi:hypothetical protein
VNQGHLPSPLAARQLERAANDAPARALRDDALGDGSSLLHALDPGVKPLGILPHQHEVDPRSRAGEGHGRGRPQVGEEVKLPPQSEDGAPVSREVGRSGHGAEEHGVCPSRRLDRLRGEADPVPVEAGKTGLGLAPDCTRQEPAEAASCHGNDLGTDPVASDHQQMHVAPPRASSPERPRPLASLRAGSYPL